MELVVFLRERKQGTGHYDTGGPQTLGPVAHVCVWAQSPSPYEIENRAIRRAKELSIASLERSLPKVTLEFFLTYEGGGAPIKWEVNHCGEQPRDAVVDCDRDSIMCVEADVALKDGRT